MTAKQNELSSQNSSGMARKGGWVMGGVLVVAAALAISFAIRGAPAKPAAEPARMVQQVPDAAVQSVSAYIQAHQGSSSAPVQVVPDASAQGVAAYIAAHQGDSNLLGQSVPDANTQGVAAYIAAHGGTNPQPVSEAYIQSVLARDSGHPYTQGVATYTNAQGPSAAPKSVLDANTQSVLAHDDGQPLLLQSVPDANTQSVTAYLTAHAGTPSLQTVPDAATQGVLAYLRAHGVHIP